MEALLVKVFATALALSLVMTRPDAVKTQFDPTTDKAEVLAVLGAGCDAVKKSFDIENIDLDGLIDTVMVDKQAAAGEIAQLVELVLSALQRAELVKRFQERGLAALVLADEASDVRLKLDAAGIVDAFEIGDVCGD